MQLSFRNRHLLASDILVVATAPWIAYVLRFEGLAWSALDGRTLWLYTVLSVPLEIALFLGFRLYRPLWRHAGVAELLLVVRAVAVAAVAAAVLGTIVLPLAGVVQLRVPISVAILVAFLTGGGVIAPRLLIKAVHTWRASRRSMPGKRTLIVGAGAAGEMILKELRANPRLDLVPVAFVDDHPAKRGRILGGVPVVGSLAEIPSVVREHEIREVIIAMPTAPGHVIRQVVRAATDANVATRTVPGLFEIVSGRVGISSLRKVEIQDLLRRAPVKTDLAAVKELVSGRSVLVTGAGGSIGSELSRHLAQLGPARLVLLGNLENEVFDIHQELLGRHPELELVPVIADVREYRRLRTVFERFSPDTVLHAAAHKHVPLMEQNVSEAITNNVLGTRNVVDCAVAAGTATFVLISTDKAVRPTSVMGATKRAAELVVQAAARKHQRQFVSVRFGNVLASRCSVVPIFLQQIERGGPVTVTHPDMRRYFMTIPEAVQLVLQAAALAKGGEIFVLDMGEPVKIVELATDLIRLSGLKLGSDIEIRYTGVRPGERLFEEMFCRDENVLPTAHPKILCARDEWTADHMGAEIEELTVAARQGRADQALRHLLGQIVPEFRAPVGEASESVAVLPVGAGAAPGAPPVERRLSSTRRRGERRLSALIAGWRVRTRRRDRRTGKDRRRGRDRRVAGSNVRRSEVVAV